MKYIIMADGRGARWNNHQGLPKHLIEIDGETLLQRTVRLLHELDPRCEVLITSHDPRYEVEGAVRYEPENNRLEIDRFTYELIQPHICFLYGDTFYSEAALRQIIQTPADSLLFFGNARTIFAVKVEDASLMKFHIDRVKARFQAGEIHECKGWQVYQSHAGLPFGDKTITDSYVVVEDRTRDFNSPQDLEQFKGNQPC